MNSRAVYFTAPRQVEIREESFRPLKAGEILAQTLVSAISPGTEKLIYQGLFPHDLLVDENLPSLSGKFSYPLKYGYSTVGRVIDLGTEVDKSWLDRLIFAFQPHQSHFVSRVEDIQPIPNEIKIEDAVFLPNMETALGQVMDGAPLIGENVAVFGQGVVGFLTTALLTQFPLTSLITFDPIPTRRQRSLSLGATTSLTPDEPGIYEQFSKMSKGGTDLTFELSGSVIALNQAIRVTGFGGRIVIGSWYGQKRASLDLGGHFHRSRIRLISSQVSSLAPELSGRWDKTRRFELAWEMIRKFQPGQLITQRVPLDQADQAYRMLVEQPDKALQIVFTYE